jgi:hypothetical protein
MNPLRQVGAWLSPAGDRPVQKSSTISQSCVGWQGSTALLHDGNNCRQSSHASFIVAFIS